MPGSKGGKSKHDRCVEGVLESNPDVGNPHAVCVAAGIEPEKWKKSEDDCFESVTEKIELVKALDEVGLRKSALNLQNWNEMDKGAQDFVDDLTKAYDDDDEMEKLEKKYMGFSRVRRRLGGKKGVYDPAGLAAYIGRKKYGKKKFQRAAAKDKKMKGMRPKKKGK